MPDEKVDDSLDAKEIPIHKKRIHTANDDSSYEEAWKPVDGKPPVNGPYRPPPTDPSLLDHDEEQLSELELQYNADGTVKLEFVSHNQKHGMLLTPDSPCFLRFPQSLSDCLQKINKILKRGIESELYAAMLKNWIAN